MKNIISVLGFLFISASVSAQQDIAVIELGNTAVIVQDSIFAISSFGKPISGTVSENGEVVTTSLFSLLRLLNIGTTRTHDVLPIEGLQIFPNPASDFLLLESENTTRYTVRLIQSDGKAYSDHEWTMDRSFSIPMSALHSGIYFLIVRDPQAGHMSTFKIVKQ